MDRQYVGIDFHRRRSVIVRKNTAGEKLSSVRVANDPWVIAAAVAEAGPEPEVVIEATYGWYWIVDLLEEQGARVRLANPSGLNWGTRRVKNDGRDAVDRAIKAINGIGPTMAAILVAEIGDVTRFRSAAALCSWAGLTPKHRESDTIVHRGQLTKQGSQLVRWAVIEGTVRYHGDT